MLSSNSSLKLAHMRLRGDDARTGSTGTVMAIQKRAPSRQRAMLNARMVNRARFEIVRATKIAIFVDSAYKSAILKVR